MKLLNYINTKFADNYNNLELFNYILGNAFNNLTRKQETI